LTSSATVWGHTIGSLNFSVRAAILLGTVSAIGSTPALAELQVRGSPEAVRIEAQDAPVEDILAALSRAFGMDYRLSINVDKRLSGTYAGSLPRVLTRILDGYNFILKTNNGSFTVTVVGIPYPAGTFPTLPASSSAQVVRHPVEAAPAAQPARVADVAPPAGSTSTAMSSHAIEVAQAPSLPAPALPATGAAPAPVPELKPSVGAPAPAPLAGGSAPAPAPEPGQYSGTAAPGAGPTPAPSMPLRGQAQCPVGNC